MTGINFNETKETRANKTRTTNNEAGEAFSPVSPELALTKRVLNNLLEDTFYESAKEQMDSVTAEFENVAATNPEFVLKLASYARNEENLRQIPQLLLVLSANDERTRQFVRAYAPSIMVRADEPLEALAMQVNLFGKSIPNSLQKGMEDALHNFNEYEYAKWDRANREFRYRDLLNLVHPRPRDDERRAIFARIAKGELDHYPEVEKLTQTDTWEDAMSSAGQDEDVDKAQVWRDSLESMGLFARIRNVRNMLQEGLTGDEIFGDVTDEWVRNSRLYPFRFYQSYKAVTDDTSVPNDKQALAFLDRAMRVSTENLPPVLDGAFVAVDTSGSMRWSTVSEHSNLTPMEIGTLFGAMLAERDAKVAAFADSIERVPLDPLNSLTSNAQKIERTSVGGGTNGYRIPQMLRQSGEVHEKVIVFTDMQMWDNRMYGVNTTFRDEWLAYKRDVAPDASLYLVDLNSYGDLVTPEGAQDVYQLSGWSENIIDFIDKMENLDAMIQTIEATEP